MLTIAVEKRNIKKRCREKNGRVLFQRCSQKNRRQYWDRTGYLRVIWKQRQTRWFLQLKSNDSEQIMLKYKMDKIIDNKKCRMGGETVKTLVSMRQVWMGEGRNVLWTNSKKYHWKWQVQDIEVCDNILWT